MAQEKRRMGDRKDGRLIRKLDAMHFITGIIYPNRCDNEAYISERVDLTNINAYLQKKNAEGIDFKYTFLHVILTALMRTVTQRPLLNRFIVNGNFYERNERTASFIIKKQFNDKSEESMAFIHAKDTDTVDTIHNEICRQVKDVRADKSGSTDDSMEFFNHLPRFISKAAVHFIMWLDRHGWVPKALIADDPYYSTVVISNLGSIKLHSGYHHLTNWGTCSLFCIIGEKKLTPIYQPDGTVVMHETLDLGLTVDERIADGYYFSRSIRLLKKLLENPELLEQPLSEEVDYE